MKITEINVNDIKPYDKNAKKHPQEQIDRIAASIREFGFKQPLVIDKENVLVIGHGRLLAAKQNGIKKVPCLYADDLTDEQIKALRLADNKTNESDWDFDFLDVELDDITDIDMSQFGFDLDDDEPAPERRALTDRFIVPPFSVLDTRQGYWNDRKREWLNMGIKSDIGRDDNLTFSITLNFNDTYKTQTSVFDPVLTEVMYSWFCIAGGGYIRPIRRRVSARHCSR